MKMGNKMEKKPLTIITGPTASGKTALGIALAKEIDGEIISADSLQIYRGMDIGTAKPSIEEMDGIVHHMIDIKDPAENYSVAEYLSAASACIEDVLARGKQAILLGGTGLYIEALLAGERFATAPQDAEIRAKLETVYDAIGGQAMWEKLRKIDDESAQILHPNDKRRIVRALEIYEISNEAMSAFNKRSKAEETPYHSLYIALNAVDRADLYQRIDWRVDLMLADGLLEEVEQLQKQGVLREYTSMQAIGYKELFAVLSGETSLLEATETIKQESRRYAKRQLSWIRRKSDDNWLLWDKKPNMEQLLEETIKRYKACFVEKG